MRRPFDGNTEPTDGFVRTLINWAEDEIDRTTHHAWRATPIEEPEYKDFMATFTAREWLDGIEIPLDHRYIRTVVTPDGSDNLETAEGDKIEVWDGASWKDWLTVFSGQSGHSGKYWILPRPGMLKIRQFYRVYRIDAIRITYRYGSPTIPGDITRACTMMVAADIAESEGYEATIPGGGDLSSPTLSQKTESWRKQAAEIVRRHTEVRTAYNRMRVGPH